MVPSVTGTVTSYSISPNLPDGLSLDTSAGLIFGMPTAPSPQTTYTVVASNAGGSTSTNIAVTVEAPGISIYVSSALQEALTVSPLVGEPGPGYANCSGYSGYGANGDGYGGFMVFTFDANGNLFFSSSSTQVVLSDGGAGGSFYSDSLCTKSLPLNTVEGWANTTGWTFYYAAGPAGGPVTITATASGYGLGPTENAQEIQGPGWMYGSGFQFETDPP